MANYQVVNGVKTLNMHGKNYVEVAERVTQVHEAKAEFDILKSEPMQVADRWLWVSVIKINGHQYMGNAEIKMNAPKNTPDGTNPFECAETSAIGRALGFAGFGSVESIASKDEIERGKPFSGAQEESKSVEKPAQVAPKPQASESKPAEQAKEAPIPTVSQLRALAAKHVGVGAFDAIVGVLQATYKTDLKVDDAWEEKHCKHAYDLLKKQINEKKQSLAKAS